MGLGFNLCVAPLPRNQVSRISDGAEKGLREIKDRGSVDRVSDSCLIRLQTEVPVMRLAGLYTSVRR